MNFIEESFKEYPIEELKLQACTNRLLKQNNIHSLYDLLQKTEDDFMKMSYLYQGKEYNGHRRFFRKKELHLLLTKIEVFKRIMQS
ncbi:MULTISPECIES: hypothetical protein [Bacillus]|uniref:RNA polymerase n=2 Tax=Bacillus thuringiensis TaxID=1428 RepID=A0AAP4Q738_BACTU|nr:MULTISPECIES: hypothetical protein [Bacillus]HDR7922214.1 RNA polymerase [Bacillus paranthracis]AFV21496.1 RNA polymerase alpha subunit [Bacillus thuringiensis Bt407]EEM25469.1 RNA polymerase alpha subunit [Bacillus thuringiensis Bt407]ERI01328.1 Ribosomal protein S11 [Bacillus thuringiensis T01-328]MBN6708060.1 RNA polymerase [Bacillus thuringiensis]